MLQRNLAKASSKNGLKASFLARAASSVCIIGGFPSADRVGAKIIKDLKERSGEEIDFYGVGGREMKDQGLRNIGDISKVQDNPWFPYKNMTFLGEKLPFHPVMAGVHKGNY